MSTPTPPDVPQTLPLPDQVENASPDPQPIPATVTSQSPVFVRKLDEAPPTLTRAGPAEKAPASGENDTLNESPRPQAPAPAPTEQLDPVGQENDTQPPPAHRELRPSAQYGATLDSVPPTNPGFPPAIPETIDRTFGPAGAEGGAFAPEPFVAGYELLGELGRGGMGVVYKARQVGLNRLVAIKMILAGGHAGKNELSRFKAEAEAIARLQHPNIVQIHDVGTQDGKPFFSLEFCEGGSLADKLGAEPLSPAVAATLAEVLARAMHCAHLQGIVHRDLKPANVLLGPRPGSGNSSVSALPFGVPKITDFGLAKDIKEQSGQTQSGAIMGTPNYMAPEQAAGKIKEIGPAADVYALGAILYECLTGRPPFRGDTPWDTVNQVLTEDPLPPGRLRRRLPRDLETICLKCLRKEPQKRYASAEALADDLRRFQEGKLILARPSGSWEWMLKWARRQPAVAALLVLLTFVIVGGLIGMSVLYGITAVQKQAAIRAREKEAAEREKAETARAEADRQRDWSRRVSYAARMNLAQTALQEAQIDRASTILADLAKRKPDEEDLRGFEWYYLQGLSRSGLELKEHTNLISRVAFSPDGERVASASLDHTVRLWDTKTGGKAFLKKLAGHTAPVRALAYSSDGKRLASGGEDNVVFVWDARTGKRLSELRGHKGWVIGVAFAADGKRLVSGSEDKTVRVWNLNADGAQAGAARVLEGHTAGVLCVAISGDGLHIASGGWDRTVRLWNAATGKLEHTLAGDKGHTLWVSCVAFDPDSKRLASGSWDKSVKLWNVAAGSLAKTLGGYSSPVRSLSFSPDGERLATLSDDRTPRVWDLTANTSTVPTAGGTDRARGVGFSADGQLLVSVRFDYSGKALDADTVLLVDGHQNAVHAVDFLPGRGGKRATPELVSAGADRTVRVWRLLGKGEVEERLTLEGAEGPVRCVACSPDGKTVAGGSEDGNVYLWDTGRDASGKQRRVLKGHDGWVHSVAFSPDGKLLASAGTDGSILLWDLARLSSSEPTPRFTLTGHEGPVYAVAFRPDGKRLASAGGDKTVRLWDPATGKEVRVLRKHKGQARAVAYSRDGRLASGSWDGAVCLWDADGKAKVLTGHTYGVTGVHFSPDGKRLASSSEDHTVKLWDLSTCKELLTLRGPDAGATGVRFSPDGRLLASSSWDQQVRVWRATRK